jgi:hypothetical protein
MLASASALADEPSEADLAAMRAAAEEDGEDVQEVEEVRSDDGSDAPADRQPDIDETVAQNGGPEDTVVDVENVERVAGGPVVENSALVAEDSLVGPVAATGGRRLRGKTNLVADVRPSAKAKGKAKGKCKGTQAPTENEEKDEGEKTKAAPNAQKVKAPRGRKRKADEASLGAEGASTLQSFFGATASQSQDVPDSAVDANASEAPKETEEAAPTEKEEAPKEKEEAAPTEKKEAPKTKKVAAPRAKKVAAPKATDAHVVAPVEAETTHAPALAKYRCFFCDAEEPDDEDQKFGWNSLKRNEKRCKPCTSSRATFFKSGEFSKVMLMTDEDRHDLFEKAKSATGNQKLQMLRSISTCNFEKKEETKGASSQFQPLSYWATLGYDTALIEKHTKPEHIEDNPVLGKCYYVPITIMSNLTSKGQESKDCYETARDPIASLECLPGETLKESAKRRKLEEAAAQKELQEKKKPLEKLKKALLKTQSEIKSHKLPVGFAENNPLDVIIESIDKMLNRISLTDGPTEFEIDQIVAKAKATEKSMRCFV